MQQTIQQHDFFHPVRFSHIKVWGKTTLALILMLCFSGVSYADPGERGLITGAAVGATAGAWIGSQQDEAAEGAVVGAMFGALAGLLLSDDDESPVYAYSNHNYRHAYRHRYDDDGYREHEMRERIHRIHRHHRHHIYHSGFDRDDWRYHHRRSLRWRAALSGDDAWDE